MSFVDRLRAGLVAFREAYLTSSVVNTDAWDDVAARQLRYQVLWAQYEQTSYRDIHSWAAAYRHQYALYKYIRPVYNPSYRTGEFWKAHIFGGMLDADAGPEGAIPIITENELLRPAIADLWKWSRWQVRKDILAVRGTILGDVAIQVVDDVEREQVYLDLLYPGLLKEVVKDPFGNVKAYTIEEIRADPGGSSRTVRYTETVGREGDNVVYATFLNDQPYAWPGNANRSGEDVSMWSEPYGFIPLVLIQHNDVGLDWGWSELHSVRAKVQEVDGVASQVSDHIRKAVDPVWLMRGMKQASVTVTGAEATVDKPQPGREELKAIWTSSTDANADAMISEIDMQSVLLHIDNLLAEIERDIPELSQDIKTASGDASGRALRTARQPIASKVRMRRANYDGGLVAAQQMAIAIGGWRGYAAYKGFDLNSYDRGDLEHAIAFRPVFEEDPLDIIEIDAAFWDAAAAAKSAGVALESYLREAGWDEERISSLVMVPGPVIVTPEIPANNKNPDEGTNGGL